MAYTSGNITRHTNRPIMPMWLGNSFPSVPAFRGLYWRCTRRPPAGRSLTVLDHLDPRDFEVLDHGVEHAGRDSCRVIQRRSGTFPLNRHVTASPESERGLTPNPTGVTQRQHALHPTIALLAACSLAPF